MRIRTVLYVGLLCAAPLSAQELTEPADYPNAMPGRGAVQAAGGCFLLATGSITPGDVDWVSVTIPFDSDRTVVDVDFTDNAARSFLLVLDDAGGSMFTMADSNGSADDVCGLGSSSVVLGSAGDSAVDFGATPANTVLDVGVTGANDFGFAGGHSQQFDYEIWVYAGEPEVGCSSDADCDDGVDCTFDVCDLAGGICAHETDDAFCDNGLFCDGAEVCDAAEGCVFGTAPCQDAAGCDEDGEECIEVSGPSIDIRPGVCPNWINPRSRGVVHVAVLSGPGFDASEVDPSSLMLSRSDGQGGVVAPWLKRGARVMDVGSSPSGGEVCDCAERQPDGVMDLVVKFRTGPVVDSLSLSDFHAAETVSLTLSGATFGGEAFEASDCVKVAPLRKRHKHDN